MTAAVRHRLPTRPAWALVAVVILILMRLLGIQEPSQTEHELSDHPTVQTTTPPKELPPAGELHRVRRAVDGDTLLLENGVRVRLIGVDTPETKHPDRPPQPYGAEASEYTRQRVEGREVRLEYDRERFDDYRRTLAYVYVDGELLNEELLRGGYGKALLRFPYRDDMKRRFREAEKEARDARRGLWGLPPTPSEPNRTPSPVPSTTVPSTPGSGQQRPSLTAP